MTTAIASIALLLLFAAIGRLILTYRKLRAVPGPFLASLTNLWRVWVVHKGDAQDVYLELHRRYGPAVRIGPNCVSLSSLDALQGIYSISARFPKSDFYPVQQATINGKPYANLFNTTDEAFHANIKRPVARAYAMSKLIEFEPFVDTTTRLFVRRRLQELFASEALGRPTCDFGKWLQYYTFDVIGELTFSKPFGFLERDEDVDGIIDSLHQARMVLTQIPWLDRLLRKNKFRLTWSRSTSPVVAFTRARVQERVGLGNASTSKPLDDATKRPQDFLSYFLQAQTAYPEVVDDLRVLAYATSNVNAGSDTTAITLRTVFYYLLKNPLTMKRLETELQQAAKNSQLSTPCVSYAESQALPYLDAVIKEALRIHPAVGLPLERVVPPSGADISGITYPGGTVVGVNAWVIHRDYDVFGRDADDWRPERWLESSGEVKKNMERTMFAFGGGSRTCIGKNISLLEVYKLVPTLLHHFEFELVDPRKEWTLFNAFFVHQTNFNVRVRMRNLV